MKKPLTLQIYLAFSIFLLFAEPITDSNLVLIAYYGAVFLNLLLTARRLKKMHERDQALIKQSFLTKDWSEVASLKEKAESDEAKEILKDREVHLYRREEWFANQL